MATLNDLRGWLESITNDSIPMVASKLGVTHGNLYKQLKGETPIPPATVVRISRMYAENPIPGLVACGLIEQGEATEFSEVRSASDQILIREIEYRLNLRSDR